MAVTDAGLVVPDSAVTKTSCVLPKQTLQLMRRVGQALKHEQLGFLVVCLECKTPLNIGVDESKVHDPKRPAGQNDQVLVSCRCTERVVR